MNTGEVADDGVDALVWGGWDVVWCCRVRHGWWLHIFTGCYHFEKGGGVANQLTCCHMAVSLQKVFLSILYLKVF